MLGWATLVAGVAGLLLGNLLNRSMEFRKWRRAERHKACAQLLEACQTTVNLAAFRHAVPTAVRAGLQDPMEQFANLLRSQGLKGQIGRVFAKPVLKAMVRRMNPEASGEDLRQSVSGMLASVAAHTEEPVVDFVAERLGAGASGQLTRMRESAHRLGMAIESVELICPDRVVQAARSLFDAALALVTDGQEDDLEQRLSRYSEARRSFVLAARQDLVSGRLRRTSGQRI
ncbi:hypothetical protein ACWCO3_15375 [Micromonospora sp. NPDC002411]